MITPDEHLERLVRVEAGLSDMHTDVHEIKSDVRQIRETLHGRPSWAIAALVTFLSSSLVGMLVAFVTVK